MGRGVKLRKGAGKTQIELNFHNWCYDMTGVDRGLHDMYRCMNVCDLFLVNCSGNVFCKEKVVVSV